MPYPAGLPIERDRDLRSFAGGQVLVGGHQGTAIRLDQAQQSALAELASGWADDAPSLALARALVDGGYAHPRPAPAPVTDVTVVIPVRDRAEELDGCLLALGAAAPVLVVDDGSGNPAAVAEVAKAHGAQLVVRPVSGGPGQARNSGFAASESSFVAFLDSDTRPPVNWLSRQLGHFADPTVAAVAPRVIGQHPRTLSGRYLDARSPLDLGPNPAAVRPGGPVAYVPTAAMILRRAAVSAEPFDPLLRYGEDIDLVWRLHEAGWQVRYDPSVVVDHLEPTTWSAVLTRRFHYGTGSARLAERHPGLVTPVAAEPALLTIATALLAGRPAMAAGAAVAPVVRSRNAMVRAGVPEADASRLAATSVAKGMLSTSSKLSVAISSVLPLMVIPLFAKNRARTLALVAAPALADWARRRPEIDPLRWTAIRLLDEGAHGLGVWYGSWRDRRIGALLPRFHSPDRERRSE